MIDPRRLEQFILALEHPEGGFRAAAWDQSTDVEYTFYALGTLGLLWSGDMDPLKPSASHP